MALRSSGTDAQFLRNMQLYSYKKKTELDFDVYILDIEMGEMSGLELAKKLRQDSPIPLSFFLQVFLNMFMMFLKL